MPSLYVVATPIGNLEDISLRALRVLREVKLVAAEDTRKTRRLLTKYDIRTPTTSYYEHSRLSKMEYILNVLQKDDVALVSEAGMPGISDPGYELINAAIKQNIPVVPIPGPSVVVTALAVSGLPTDRFVFIGFLPHKSAERKRLLESVAAERGTIVLFETPHRLKSAFQDILAILGDRKVAVCRELTKLHEEVFHSTISEAAIHFAQPRGEFVLVIEGNVEQRKPELTAEVQKRLYDMYLSGAPAKKAVAIVAGETGLSRKELYQLWLSYNKGV